MKTAFSIIACALIIGAFVPYLRDMLRKKTTPHAYTWLIWSITQGTAAIGLWYGNGGWGTIPLAVGTVFVFAVFLLSFRYGTKNITRSDMMMLIAALCAIVIWWQMQSPLLAILLVSAIDFIGYVPSFRKSFNEPWSETATAWGVFCVANIFTMLALHEYHTLTLIYPLTLFIANFLLLAICLIRRQGIPRPVLPIRHAL